MEAWLVEGRRFGDVVFANGEAAAREEFAQMFDEEIESVTRKPFLDGERRQLSNADLQRAGLSVFCDRCIDTGAIEYGIDEPDNMPLVIVGDEVVCDQCITPREKLAAGGDSGECLYAEEYMDTPIGGLPRDVVPLADQ